MLSWHQYRSFKNTLEFNIGEWCFNIYYSINQLKVSVALKDSVMFVVLGGVSGLELKLYSVTEA
jgi:hypothetical protein